MGRGRVVGEKETTVVGPVSREGPRKADAVFHETKSGKSARAREICKTKAHLQGRQEGSFPRCLTPWGPLHSVGQGREPRDARHKRATSGCCTTSATALCTHGHRHPRAGTGPHASSQAQNSAHSDQCNKCWLAGWLAGRLRFKQTN